MSDEELLLFSDQELATRPAAEVREHVAQCDQCRKRLADLENASACIAELHEQEIHAQRSLSVSARERLKARLSDAPTRNRGAGPAFFRSLMAHQLARASLALLLVVGTTWTIRHILAARSGLDDMKTDAIVLPRRTLTPGGTRAVQVADLCGNQDLDNDPPVNPSLEQEVFKEYGVPASSKKDYELDYLITPALGGADSIQNLWPQSYSSTWNARVKDQLEDHLHEMVCQGKVQLATAQNDIASDWIEAYKRYFNSDKPRPDSSITATVRSRRDFERRERRRMAATPLV
jgi:hypothetical protein